MNPGSISIPKEDSLHSYMILDEKFEWKDLEAKYIWRKKSDEKEKNPVWADRNRNQFVYEWLHGTDAEGEADVSDKRKRSLSRI